MYPLQRDVTGGHAHLTTGKANERSPLGLDTLGIFCWVTVGFYEIMMVTHSRFYSESEVEFENNRKQKPPFNPHFRLLLIFNKIAIIERRLTFTGIVSVSNGNIYRFMLNTTDKLFVSRVSKISQSIKGITPSYISLLWSLCKAQSR